MKIILVTGGAGYIGSHTVIELSKNGYDIIIIDNFSNSNPISLNNLYKLCLSEGISLGKTPKFYDRDCRDDITDILTKYNGPYSKEEDRIVGVIHFAAFKSVGESVDDPLNYYDNNINSLLNILDSCKVFGIENVVFSSSCSLYGDVKELPVTEETQLSDPESPYAYTKLVGERILKDFCKANPNINAISLRYFNPVGAHESGLIGESPINKPNNIIPVICNATTDGNDMTIFGNNYDTKDGTCIRDYVHVSDIANAHVLALEYMMKGVDKNFDIFNLGSDNGVSVLELINKFEELNDIKVNYKIGDRREGDIVKIYSDSTKAKNILGWSTKRNIDDMVKSAWIWHNNSIN